MTVPYFRLKQTTVPRRRRGLLLKFSNGTRLLRTGETAVRLQPTDECGQRALFIGTGDLVPLQEAMERIADRDAEASEEHLFSCVETCMEDMETLLLSSIGPSDREFCTACHGSISSAGEAFVLKQHAVSPVSGDKKRVEVAFHAGCARYVAAAIEELWESPELLGDQL